MLSTLGDWASILGFLVSVGGFVVTIREARNARRAAEEAQRMAREAVARIGSQLLGNEIGVSLHLVREADAACRERNWPGALYRCDEARIRLAQLLDHPELEASERELIRGAEDDFRMFLSEFQKLRDAHEPKTAPPRVTTRLHDIIVALSQIKGRLENREFEAFDER